MSWRGCPSSPACKLTSTCPTSLAGKYISLFCISHQTNANAHTNTNTGNCSATRSLHQVQATTWWARTSSEAGGKQSGSPTHLLLEVPGSWGIWLVGNSLLKTFSFTRRDHGIPGYGKVREKCGLSPILSLQDRPAEINEVNPGCVDNYLVQENWAKLSEVYQKVEDVDLYVGGLSETPVGGKHCWLNRP